MPLVNWLDMERLGSIRLGTAAVTTGALTIPAREQLFILFSIAGFSAADIPAIRFNGDTGTTYFDRHITYALGGTTATNVQTPSTNMLRISGSSSATGRVVAASVMNLATVAKPVILDVYNGVGLAAGTAAVIDVGGGEWVNTAAQITSVELRSVGGVNTLSVGSGFTVFGCNP